jgi:predicted DNA binding CopG/RHH family protein
MDQNLKTHESKVPAFKTEKEEAQWWFENQDVLAQRFKRAATEGRLGRGTLAQRGKTPTTTIRLDPGDIAKARLYAERRGLKYQTYLKMLIRQALVQEEFANRSISESKETHMSKASKHPGLDGRSRDADGEIRKKRSDTLVGTLRAKYGENFAAGYRSDTQLGTVLKREGVNDLSQLRKKNDR